MRYPQFLLLYLSARKCSQRIQYFLNSTYLKGAVRTYGSLLPSKTMKSHTYTLNHEIKFFLYLRPQSNNCPTHETSLRCPLSGAH